MYYVTNYNFINYGHPLGLVGKWNLNGPNVFFRNVQITIRFMYL